MKKGELEKQGEKKMGNRSGYVREKEGSEKLT